MNIDLKQPVDRVRVLFKRIAEDCDAGIHHQHIQRPAVAHPRNHGIAIRTVGQDGRAACLARKLFCRFTRAGIGEGHCRAIRYKALHDCRTYSPAATEHQNGLSLKYGHMTLLEL